MSYDEQGNFQIDVTDPEDVGSLHDARERRQFDKIVQQEEDQAKAAQFQQQFAGQSWQEALKESNLSQEEYNQICAENPQAATELIKNSPKMVTRGVAALKGKPPQQRDPRGQFIPQGPQPQQGAQRQVAQGGDIDAQLEAAKTKSRKSGLSYEDELDVIDTLFQAPAR